MGSNKPVLRSVRSELEKSLEEKEPKNPFLRLSENISRPHAFHLPGDIAKWRGGPVKVAMVSLPRLGFELNRASIVGKDDRDGVDLEACRRALVDYKRKPSRQHHRQRHSQWYEDGLRYAVEEFGADIVCVNELGFPVVDQRPRIPTEQLTRRLATKHNCLIVAGSSHDRRTFYNTGNYFYPDCPPQGEPYHKQVSAPATGELVSVPPVRRTLCTQAFGLQVAVLVCLDLADFSSVAAVVRREDKVDLLLVPCYSEWMDELRKITLAASEAMSGSIALVNYQHPGASADCFVAEFGNPVENLKTKRVPGSKVRVTTYEIDNDWFWSEKQKRQVQAKTKMRWLFGDHTIPTIYSQ